MSDVTDEGTTVDGSGLDGAAGTWCEMFFERSLDLCCVAGFDGRFRMLNPRWTTVLGYTVDEMLERPFIELVHHEDRERTMRHIGALMKGSIMLQFENRFLRKDGGIVHLSWNATAIVEQGVMLATARDMTMIRGIDEELALSEATMSAILRESVDAIVIIDPRGTIQLANPAAERMFGYSSEELLGRNVKMLMPDPYRREHDGYLEHYLATGERRVIGVGREVVAQRRDGTTFPIELAVSEVKVGETHLFAGNIRDISERHRIESIKNEFVSMVSHELRTPMTAIKGSLGLVLGGAMGELPGDAREMVSVALNNSERLIRLINDILDMDKISSGKMAFHFEEVDLVDLVRSELDANGSYAEQHETTFELGDVPGSALVLGDRDRLAQVLANLLSNAAKFTRAGEPVTVAIATDGNDVTVSVTDRGPGIPDEFHDRIFERFAQADSSSTRAMGGTGLGLNITKAILERHGGSIGFDTEIGVGTTFRFTIPLLERGSASVDGTSETRRGRPVLVVEDDPSVARVMRRILEVEGYCVDVATGVEDAHRLLETRAYAAVTIDIMLPDGDGLSLARELRSDPRTAELPIVIVSALEAPGTHELQGTALSIADWLVKPVDGRDLVTAVRARTRRRSDDMPTVLHVEDDPDMRTIVRRTLANDAHVVEARTTAEARELLGEERFDLVILDLDLPDGDGRSLLPLIGRWQSAPVLVHSAYDVDDDLVARVAEVLRKGDAGVEDLRLSVLGLLEG